METKRIKDIDELDDSSVCYWKDSNGLYFIRIPNVGIGNLGKHTIEEHENGTITVSPSILMTGMEGRQAHGFLKKGVWEECP